MATRFRLVGSAAVGHHDAGDLQVDLAWLMATSGSCVSGCPRHPNFSNPTVSLFGRPTGVAGARDNHAVGDDVALVASGWRSERLLFSDGFEGGTASRWSAPVS